MEKNKNLDSKDLPERINIFQENKKTKMETDELIKTLMNFAVLFLILSILPILPNIQTAQIILPTVLSFSPSLALAYFVVIWIMYRYYKVSSRKKE